MRSTLLIMSVISAALAQEGYTATVINTSTVTITSCSPGVDCPAHHTSTSTVLVSGASSPAGVSTTCETPVGSTLLTSIIPSVVSATPASSNTVSVVVSSSSYLVPSSAIPSSVAAPSSVGSGAAATTPPVPSTIAPGTVPFSFSNSTTTVPTFTGLLTASGSPSVPIIATSVVVVGPSSNPTTGSAPSSSATGLNGSGHMAIPGVMLGFLALGACLFA